MVELRPIIILVVIAIVVIFLIYTVFLSKPAKKSTTTPPASNTANYSNITPPPNITSKNVVVKYYAVNVQYVYSGPATMNSTTICNYQSHSYIDSTSLTTNGTVPFELYFNLGTTGCPLTIYNIVVNTPGFALDGTEPNLPINMAPNSQIAWQIDLVTPSYDYSGPLTITIYDN